MCSAYTSIHCDISTFRGQGKYYVNSHIVSTEPWANDMQTAYFGILLINCYNQNSFQIRMVKGTRNFNAVCL